MTREEAIEWMQEEKASFERAPDLNGCPMTEYWQKAIDVYDMAISALRQQDHFREVTKKVEPLTLDELRKMDGEPVWWWIKSAKPVCTICVWDRFMKEPMFANYDWQSEDTLKLSKYKWLKKCGYKPYRQKPEEGTV